MENLPPQEPLQSEQLEQQNVSRVEAARQAVLSGAHRLGELYQNYRAKNEGQDSVVEEVPVPIAEPEAPAENLKKQVSERVIKGFGRAKSLLTEISGKTVEHTKTAKDAVQSASKVASSKTVEYLTDPEKGKNRRLVIGGAVATVAVGYGVYKAHKVWEEKRRTPATPPAPVAPPAPVTPPAPKPGPKEVVKAMHDFNDNLENTLNMGLKRDKTYVPTPESYADMKKLADKIEMKDEDEYGDKRVTYFVDGVKLNAREARSFLDNTRERRWILSSDDVAEAQKILASMTEADLAAEDLKPHREFDNDLLTLGEFTSQYEAHGHPKLNKAGLFNAYKGYVADRIALHDEILAGTPSVPAVDAVGEALKTFTEKAAEDRKENNVFSDPALLVGMPKPVLPDALRGLPEALREEKARLKKK